MNEPKDGEPAFPGHFSTAEWQVGNVNLGMSLRQYFAIHAPPPTESDISFQAQLDLSRNPYNEPGKPPRRSPREIEVDLRYQYADLMLARQ